MKTTTNYIDDDQKHKTQLVQDTHTTTCKRIKYFINDQQKKLQEAKLLLKLIDDLVNTLIALNSHAP